MAEATMPRPGAVALVTGASTGIGRAVAEALAGIGCRVVCTGRRKALLDEIAGNIGDAAYPLELDVTDPASVDSLPARLPEGLRAIDILVNNAGSDVGGRERFDQGDVADWVSTVETNLTGLIRVTHVLIPGMIERDLGHVVNIGSVAGFKGYAGGTIYAATKFAVHGFSESLRLDYCNTGVRVTEIMPGMVRTDFARARWNDARKAEDFYTDFGACLAPEDIAQTVVFALQQPPHVVISQLVVVPNSQS